MKNFFKKYDDLLWSLLLLFFAFFFSAAVPPYIGLIVFLAFFVLSVGLFLKWMGYKKDDD